MFTTEPLISFGGLLTDFALRADGGRGAGVGRAGFGFGRSEGEAPSGFGRIWAWFKEAIRSWMDNGRSSSSAIKRGNNNGNGNEGQRDDY